MKIIFLGKKGILGFEIQGYDTIINNVYILYGDAFFCLVYVYIYEWFVLYLINESSICLS